MTLNLREVLGITTEIEESIIEIRDGVAVQGELLFFCVLSRTNLLTSDRHRGSDSPKPSSISHRANDHDKRDSSIPKSSIQYKDPTTASNLNGTNGNSVEAKENRSISDQCSSSVAPTTTPEIVSILS